MKCLILFVILMGLGALFFTGCETHSGSREFIPGKGWVPND